MKGFGSSFLPSCESYATLFLDPRGKLRDSTHLGRRGSLIMCLEAVGYLEMCFRSATKHPESFQVLQMK